MRIYLLFSPVIIVFEDDREIYLGGYLISAFFYNCGLLIEHLKLHVDSDKASCLVEHPIFKVSEGNARVASDAMGITVGEWVEV